MGGVDKAALEVGGVRLLDRVLAAARPVCDQLVVVGPPRPTTVPGVTFLSEDPPGGGPVPAVAAARSFLAACDPIVVLATDLPLVRSDHLRTLLAALDHDPPPDAAAAIDHFGPNPLLAAYRSAALGRALAALGPGSPAARLLPDAPVAVDLGAAILNVNAPDDLVAAELLASLDPDVADTAHWLREVVLAAVPGALEAIEPERGFDYRHPGGQTFCSIRLAMRVRKSESRERFRESESPKVWKSERFGVGKS